MAEDLVDRLGKYREYVLLHAELTGLEWGKDGHRIKANVIEKDRLRKELGLAPGAIDCSNMNGFYWSGEELCGVWMVGQVEPWSFLQQAVEYVARELDCQTCFEIHTVYGLAGLFGPRAIDVLFNLVAEMLPTIRVEHRRLMIRTLDEADGIEPPKFAPIGTDNPSFEEAALVVCQAGDEYASLVTAADFSNDAFQELGELIELRAACARRASRGEPLPEAKHV